MSPLWDASTVREDSRQTARDDERVHASGTLPAHLPEGRYEAGDLLGVGGMGEVRRCRDQLIGRDVAMKTIRGQASGAQVHERFLREVRVQGQLEHPCIVPVYDLGVRDDGTTYFTMKRIRGVTLEQILAALREGDTEARARWTRRKLLAAFVTTCGAIEFAHRRGVIHRDLKPANIMLGDFGEVYVLDWGVARILDGSDDAFSRRIDAPTPQTGQTAEGAVVGTAGYMPPEQLTGNLDIDERADIYALGTILFEILCWEPLHRGLSVGEQALSTLGGADARPSARALAFDIPPEMDAICVRATEMDRERRFPHTRALLDAVERVLEGDRDLERRRTLAAELVNTAAEEATKVFSGEEQNRPKVLRDVGRALALDPENAHALRTLVKVIITPPKEIPPEVQASMEADYKPLHLASFRGGAIGYGIWLALTPLAFWMGVREWGSFLGMVGLIALSGALCAYVAHTKRYVVESQRLLMALSLAAAAAAGRLAGPFVLVPPLALVVTSIFTLTPERTWRKLFLAMGAIGLTVPIVLELSGLVEPSYTFRGDVIEVHARMTHLSPLPIFGALALVHLGMLLASSVIYGRMRTAFEQVSLRLHLQAWQLKQIVPGDRLASPVSSG